MAGSSGTLATYDLGALTGVLSGINLRASTLITASAAGTAAYVGMGTFIARLILIAIEVDSSNEGMFVDIQANTKAATSTWYDIARIGMFGDTVATGANADSTLGTYVQGIVNPYDHQLRVYTNIVGTIGTGFDYTLDIYPMRKL
jgi:hypothetical protein